MFPSKDKTRDDRDIAVGEKVCVKTLGTDIKPGVVTEVHAGPSGSVRGYSVRVEGEVLSVGWIRIGTYPHTVSPTAVDVLTRDTLNQDVIRKIKTYGGKKTRKLRKVRKSRKSRTRKSTA